MPQLLFDFNPHNDRVENVVRNVAYATPADGTTTRFIVPANGPFFREGHSVTSNGVLLVEGKDYYLALKYHTATHQTAKEIYGAIWLFPRTGLNSINVTINTLGSTYAVENTAAVAFVRSRIIELQTLSWEDVMGYEPFFPPVNIQFDRDAWIDEVTLTTAIQDVASAIDAKEPEDNVLYVVLREWLVRLHAVMDATTAATHASDKNNPHGSKWHHSKALKSNGIAADAAKAYSRTIGELTAYINERGVTQAHLDACMTRLYDKTMSGDLVGRNGGASLVAKNSGGTLLAQLDLSTKNLTLWVNNGIELAADSDMNSVGVKATLAAGKNKLTITSSGGVEDLTALKYNDNELLHLGNISANPPSTPIRVIAVSTSNTASVTLSGIGTDSNPLIATAVFPQANSSQAGTAVLSNSINEADRFKVATSLAANLLFHVLDDKVPNTRTVNGRRLNADINLVASDVGLGNVANVSDVNLPVNNNHRALTVNKTAGAHRHSPAQVNAPQATVSVPGISALTHNMLEVSATKAVSGQVVKEKHAELVVVENDLPYWLPDDVIDITQYGGNSYLPIPVAGEFGEAGDNRASLSIVGLVEQDGKLVLLRNGADSFGSGIYYWYTSVRDDGTFYDEVSTSVLYEPKYLKDKGFSTKLINVRRGSSSAFVALASDGAYHLILTYATMNMDKHIGATVTFAEGSAPGGYGHYSMVVDDKVFVIGTSLASDHYITQVWWCLKDDVINNNSVVMQKLGLSGKGYYGHVQTNVDVFEFAPRGIGTPTSREFMAVDDSNGYWTTRNVRHGPMSNYDIETNGDLIRVAHFSSVYLANAFTNRWGPTWKTSYTVNLKTGAVVLDHTSGFPIRLVVGGYAFTGEDLNQSSHGTMEANYASGILSSRGFKFNYAYSNITAAARLNSLTINSKQNHYDTLKAVVGASLGVVQHSSVRGNYGSPVESTMRGFVILPGDWVALKHYAGGMFALSRFSRSAKYAPTDQGLGPTTDRRSITEGEYLDILAVPTIVDSNGTIRNQGYTFTDNNNTAAGKCEIVNFAPTARTVSLAAGVYASLETQLRNKLPLYNKAGQYISSSLTVTLYGDHRVAADRDMLATLVIISLAEPGGDVKMLGSISVEVNFNVSGDVITSLTAGQTLLTYDQSYSVSSTYVQDTAMTSSTRAHTKSGEKMFVAGQTPVRGGIGGSTGIYLMAWKTPANAWIGASYSGAGPYYTLSAALYHPYIGQFHLTHGQSEESAIMTVRGESYAAFNTILKTGYFLATKVAEGWIIYFTQPVPFFISTKEYMIPTSAIDVSVKYPTTHKNNTFFIYATVVGGVASYVLKERQEVDSTSSLYIGYCKTDGDGITELVADRATRLGKFRELTEHNAAAVVHGVDTSDLNLTNAGLGNMVNATHGSADRGSTTLNKNTYATLEYFKKLTSWRKRAVMANGTLVLARPFAGASYLIGSLPFVAGIDFNHTIVWAELRDTPTSPIINPHVRVKYGQDISFEVTASSDGIVINYAMITMADPAYIYQIPTTYQ